MADQIKPLTNRELDAFVEIMASAYPGLKIVSDDDKQRMHNRLRSTFDEPSVTIFGLSRQDRLVAGMLLYDFSMNVRGEMIVAGGLGSLAVDMLHRKRKAAKQMVSFYLEHYRQKGAALALLYPFRTDFYRRMGFGYGTKMNQYVLRPSSLRLQKDERAHIEYLDGDDLDQVLACYDRYAANTHGMIVGSMRQMKQMLSSPTTQTIGYVERGQVLGYLAYDFDNRGNFLKNDLRIKQLIYQSPKVLQELLAFLRSLADQFDWIVVNTQDRDFHHLLDDPRDRDGELIPSVYHQSNRQGVGLMYRVIDLRLLFTSAPMRFGAPDIALKFIVHDSFRPGISNGLVIRFQSGRAQIPETQEHDAVVELDVSDFSAMFMGAIGLEQLVAYGLATVSDTNLVKEINDLFANVPEPICMTAF